MKNLEVHLSPSLTMSSTTPRMEVCNRMIYVHSLNTCETAQVLVVFDISPLENMEIEAGDPITISRYLVSPLHLKTLLLSLGVSEQEKGTSENCEVSSKLTSLRTSVPGISQVIAPRNLLMQKIQALTEDTRNFLGALNSLHWEQLSTRTIAICCSLTRELESLRQRKESPEGTSLVDDLSHMLNTGKTG